uniref:Protein disulfide oxidoreductase n=1 Tax=uncultured Thiotrichaceae bacterium TaxID=298394 RepID=A0A6S6T319_9GAMM|nr:MAG: Protein disulfide oxidoreductase [uncultured Thiotrichaceae bacterium]
MSTQVRTIKKKRRWLVWLFELLIIVAIVFSIRHYQQRTLVSGLAPAFDEVTLQGEQISLDNYAGKPVMVHFWASWCGTCEFEQDSISALDKEWPVVTVAYSSGEAEEVRRYMERKGIESWTTIVDNGGELAQEYGVIAVPTSYVLDKAGEIRFHEVGLSSGWGLRLRMWFTDKFF